MEHTSKKLLQVVLDAWEDKLAQEVVALDVASLTPVAEYFVITHGKNEKQVQAIVMDLNDVIVHVFYYADREFYNLEKLWSDAPIVNIVSEN